MVLPVSTSEAVTCTSRFVIQLERQWTRGLS
jgi:hypothetical protein